MAVLKRYDGSDWVIPVLRRYTGTTWECVDLNRHTGADWEDVLTACAVHETLPVTDTFSEANGTNIHGKTTTTGEEIWTVHTGAMEVSGGQATVIAPGSATIDPGISDFDMSFTLINGSALGGDGAVFRRVDAGNYLRLDASAGLDKFFMLKYVNTVPTDIVPGGAPVPAFAPGETHILRVRAVGTSIRVYWDGNLIINATDGTHQTATQHGVTSDSVNTIFDNFSLDNPLDELSPLEISASLKAWYDVSQETVLADNASMSILTDRVGSGHANLKLGNGAYYRTNRTPDGKPAAQWTGDGARLSTGVDNFFDVGDVWTIGFVAKNCAGSGKGTGINGSGKRAYGWDAGARGVLHVNYSADPAVAWPNWVNASWPDWSTQFAVVLIVCTSAGVASCTVNGVPSSIFSQGSGFETNWDNNAHFGFGGRYMGISAEYYVGEMAEWALWDTAISASDQTSLINYWMQKHGITAPSDISVTDSFDRADNASSMGNADTGQTWVPFSSTWGINGNKAYMPTPANDKATWLDSGISDGVLTCYLTYQDPGDGILFRGLGVANNDGFLCYLTNIHIVLINPGFGSNLIVTSLAHTPGVTYKLQVSFLGNAINIFEDDVWRGVAANATQQTATRIGLRSGGATAGKRWDNLSVR